MRDVFELRDSLIDEYSVFSRSFTRIAAADIQQEVNRQYSGGRYWPELLKRVQLRLDESLALRWVTAEHQAYLAWSRSRVFQAGQT